MKREKKLFAILMATLSLQASAQVGPAWAWHTGKITNDGNVSLKSSSGTSTYNAVINPTGAVAKTNQSAVTQPPTIIIQATGSNSAYVEAVALVAAYSYGVNLSCPAGYTQIWTGTASTGGRIYYNVAGTRFSFGPFSSGNNSYIGWMVDNKPSSQVGDTINNAHVIQTSYTVSNAVGSLCTK